MKFSDVFALDSSFSFPHRVGLVIEYKLETLYLRAWRLPHPLKGWIQRSVTALQRWILRAIDFECSSPCAHCGESYDD